MRAGDFAVGVLMGVLSLWVSAVHAQTPSPEYQRHIDRGLEAYNAQRFAEARVLFEQAHAELPSARTLRALGIADYSLDDHTRAEQELRAALVHPVQPLTEEQREQVGQLLSWMEANLGRVRLVYTPANAQVSIDAKPLPGGDDRPPGLRGAEREVLLEPGEHR